MITFKEFIFEKRRNPEKNPRLSPLDQLNEIVNKYGHDVYVRFVNEPKLGHNPQSKWNTPFGLCAYPIDYVIENKMRVPYAGKMPYMVIFRVRAKTKVMELDDYDYSSYIKNIKKGLKEVLPEPYRDRLMDDSHIENLQDVWYYMYRNIQDYLASKPRTDSDRQTGLLARKVLLAAGYKGVIDPGLGIIHQNEPTQSLFFEVKDLERLDTIRTTFEYDRIDYEMNNEVTKSKHRSNIQTYEWSEIMRRAINNKKRDYKVEGKAGVYHATQDKQGAVLMVAYMVATGYKNEQWLDIIKQHPRAAINYCEKVLGGKRWPEAEPYIMKEPDFTFEYANNIIKGRWPEAESYMVQSKITRFIFDYIHNQLKGHRWPAFEQQMLSKGIRYRPDIIEYVMNVIKGRWPEAEPILKEYPNYWNQYEVFLMNLDPKNKYNIDTDAMMKKVDASLAKQGNK